MPGGAAHALRDLSGFGDRAGDARRTWRPVDRIGRWGLARTTPLIEDTGGLRGSSADRRRRAWPAIPAVLLMAALVAVGISGIRGRACRGLPRRRRPCGDPRSGPTLGQPRRGRWSRPMCQSRRHPWHRPQRPRSRSIRSSQATRSSLIAANFHTTVSAIEKLNNITDPRKLHVGQVLKIP